MSNDNEDIKLWSLKELSDKYNIPNKTLNGRCLKMGFEKTYIGKQGYYLLTEEQAKQITQKVIFVFKKITYIPIIYNIYESKMNYLKL